MASGVSSQSNVCPSVSSSASEEVISCSNCLESLKDKVDAFVFECGHVFHKDCINKQLENEKICPLCHKVTIISPARKEDADISRKPWNPDDDLINLQNSPLGVPYIRRGLIPQTKARGVLIGMNAVSYLRSLGFSEKDVWDTALLKGYFNKPCP